MINGIDAVSMRAQNPENAAQYLANLGAYTDYANEGETKIASFGNNFAIVLNRRGKTEISLNYKGLNIGTQKYALLL